MDLCPTPRNGHLLANHGDTRQLCRLSCRRWACPVCGKVNALKLRKRLHGITCNRLLTLTMPSDTTTTTEQQTRHIRHVWTLARKRICRLLGVPHVQFMAVVEYTEVHTPHLHVLANCPYIRQRQLSGIWHASGGGRIVDIRAVTTTSGAANYLTNYLTKQTIMPPRLRKWSASRGYLPPLPPRQLADGEIPPTWSYQPQPWLDSVQQLQRSGWQLLTHTDTTAILTREQPDTPPPNTS